MYLGIPKDKVVRELGAYIIPSLHIIISSPALFHSVSAAVFLDLCLIGLYSIS